MIIPVVSGIVGWGTNWIALKMTFYPLEFWPIKIWQPHDQPVGFFGWQGIIPAKAATMASDFTDMMLEKLFSIEEIFSRIHPPIMAERMRPGLDPVVKTIVSELAEEFSPAVWASLPVDVHQEIFEAVKEKTDGFIIGLMEEMKRNILKVANQIFGSENFTRRAATQQHSM